MQQLLEHARYEVRRRPSEYEQLVFEDSSLLGLVTVCSSVEFIISRWRSLQDEFLREIASALRSAPQKAWNTYLIMLTEDRPTGSSQPQLAAIEEDFAGMRKVTAAGILTQEDVAHALSPLLPVRAVTLRNESLNDRLRRTLPLSNSGLQALMSGDVGHLTELLMEDL